MVSIFSTKHKKKHHFLKNKDQLVSIFVFSFGIFIILIIEQAISIKGTIVVATPVQPSVPCLVVASAPFVQLSIPQQVSTPTLASPTA